MEAAKSFNNVIISQFVLTGVPIKVYVYGRYLTITSIDDIENTTFGFGMDEDGDMQHFKYYEVDHLLVSGNRVDLDTYNKGMGADENDKEDEEPEEEPEEEPKKEESIMKLKSIIEITKDEQDAEASAIDSEEKAAKEKFKAAQAAFKGKLKSLKDREKTNKAQTVDEVIKETNYTYGVGDIVKNKNKACPHHGSMGIVKKFIDLPDNMGTVVLYKVTNTGMNYKPGDMLTKTKDQLTPIAMPDGL